MCSRNENFMLGHCPRPRHTTMMMVDDFTLSSNTTQDILGAVARVEHTTWRKLYARCRVHTLTIAKIMVSDSRDSMTRQKDLPYQNQSDCIDAQEQPQHLAPKIQSLNPPASSLTAQGNLPIASILRCTPANGFITRSGSLIPPEPHKSAHNTPIRPAMHTCINLAIGLQLSKTIRGLKRE